MKVSDANYSAATILLKADGHDRDCENAKQFIDHALNKNPYSIHALCNKGLYLLNRVPADVNGAQDAKEHMEELIKVEIHFREATAEYANWLYKKGRTDECRDEALKLFEDLLANVTRDHNYSHHYFYVSALACELKQPHDVRSEQTWMDRLVTKSEILGQSERKQYELEMYRHLAIVQTNNYISKQMHRRYNLAKILEINDKPDLKHCTDKMIHIQQTHSSDIVIYSNFYGDVANSYKKQADQTNDLTEKKKILEKGLQIAENYQHVTASPYDIAPAACANILVKLWAIEYYRENQPPLDVYPHGIGM